MQFTTVFTVIVSVMASLAIANPVPKPAPEAAAVPEVEVVENRGTASTACLWGC